MEMPVEIENIEQLRRTNGIEDRELRQAIRTLRAGDVVRLTLLPSEALAAGETLPVRITQVRKNAFRGLLTRRPTVAGLAKLRAGLLLVFRTDHIHSIMKREPTMSTDNFLTKQQAIHGADTNSLLRMFDRAQARAKNGASQQERVRAGKAAQRIGQELEKRDVRM